MPCVTSKLTPDGRLVVIANPTEAALPPGRVFRVRPIDSTQEANQQKSRGGATVSPRRPGASS
jgi:hypothetical protein